GPQPVLSLSVRRVRRASPAAGRRDEGPEDRLSEEGAVGTAPARRQDSRSEEHTSELQSRFDLVCRLLLEKKKKENIKNNERQKVNCVNTHIILDGLICTDMSHYHTIYYILIQHQTLLRITHTPNNTAHNI